MRWGIEYCFGRRLNLIGYEKGKIGIHKQDGIISAIGVSVSICLGKIFIGVGGGWDD